MATPVILVITPVEDVGVMKANKQSDRKEIPVRIVEGISTKVLTWLGAVAAVATFILTAWQMFGQ